MVIIQFKAFTTVTKNSISPEKAKKSGNKVPDFCLLAMYAYDLRNWSRPVVSSAQLYSVMYVPSKALIASISPSSIR